MVGKMKRRIGIMFFAMLCVMALACACTIRKTPDDTTAPETTNSETTEESVREATPTPTNQPTSEPTPTPTKKPTSAPTPTPTPTPASVYIPREELPDGQLFEKGYYAVLPGEGAYYNVFDCYGKQVASFTFTDAEGIDPTGVHTEQSLSPYYRFNESKVQSIIPENEYGNWIYSNENGFYEIDYEEDQVILYNKSGKYIQTVSSDSETKRGDTYEWWDIVVSCYGDETVVSFSTSDWDPVSHSATIYFVESDGTINDKCVAKDLPGKPFGLLGRKYFLLDKGDWDSTNCDIYTFDGALLIENVSVMEEYSSTLVSSEGMTFIRVSDYYIKDGITYDSSFSAVSKNKLDPAGNLIYGVDYDVDGITCTAKYWRQGHQYYSVFEPSELIAMGTQNGRTAIKTCDSEYVFDCIGEYYSMNDFVLVLTDKNDAKQVVSLETGEVLYTINKAMEVQVANEYIILVPLYPAEADYGYNHGTFILDKDGNVRYVSLIAYAKCTLGEYIVLYRGPYVGIADLNGEWIIKSLTWEITRDQEYVYPWE